MDVVWKEIKTALDWADLMDAHEQATEGIPASGKASTRQAYHCYAVMLAFMVADPKRTADEWEATNALVLQELGQEAMQRLAQKKTDLEKERASYGSFVYRSESEACENSTNGSTPKKSKRGQITTT